jgi:hypothetical protein
MGTDICVNYKTCRLVTASDYKMETIKKQMYLKSYCNTGTDRWKTCKRYITKNELNFCPDFVLPDTALSPDEIVEKFDEDESLQ